MVKMRDEVPSNDRWDLSGLFESDEAWHALYRDVEKDLTGYEDYRGRIGESFERFLGVVEFDLSMGRKIDRLHTYAHLKNDEDKTNQSYQGLYEMALNLHSRAAGLSSFIVPEIMDIPEETAAAYRGEDDFSGYVFYLEKILRYKPHTRSRDVEEVLALSGEVTSAPGQIFSQLNNADLTFGRITGDNGEETDLTHGNFITFLMSPQRETRKKAFFQYYEVFDGHKHTIAAALGASMKRDALYARVKNYGSCLEKGLFPDNVDQGVYDNLIDSVKAGLDPLFEYYRFRKKTLGLSELQIYDTYVPIVGDVEFSLTYEEAVDICVEALAPLGSEYCEILKKGLTSGWVDRYENRGKRSGAYSSGCYDSEPFILMNYEENDINSLFTLIHEAGHSMHSYYSRKHQPYRYHGYTIFVAEVASTVNETLLSRYLLEKYRDDNRMTCYILNRELDNIKGTLYRQTMFAEFEKRCHAVVEENRPPTLAALTDIYGELLADYFGGEVVLDDLLRLECLRIPHFYSPFYVYKYATGISAAIALSEKILSGGEQARDAYLAFLKMGGSKFPLDELKAAGVDMGEKEPVLNAVAHFGEIVRQLKENMER